MNIDLDQVLALTGDLSRDESRERFRAFLLQSAKDPDAIGELLASALKGEGHEYRLDLEDLVVSLGASLGFELRFPEGGGWASPSGVSFLLEVVGEGVEADLGPIVERIESNVSISSAPPETEEGEEAAEKGEGSSDPEGRMTALGLLVALDSEILRVEGAIAQGDEAGLVRGISISALLTLSKMAKDYHLTHGDVLLLLLTSGPSVDPLIGLISRIISQCEAETPTLEEIAQILSPIGRGGEGTSEEALAELIDQSRYYAFGSRSEDRKHRRL